MRRPFAGLVGLMCALPGLVAAVEIDSQLWREMRAELAALRARVEALERRLEAAEGGGAPAVASRVVTPTVVEAEDEPAASNEVPLAAQVPESPPSQPVTAAGTALSFGGRIKVDAIASSASAGAASPLDVRLFPGSLPLASEGEAGQITGSARGSRLWFQALDAGGGGLASAYLELDFYGAPGGNERVTNSLSPRLRHAYASYGPITVGQTWSTFMNASAFPEINDDGIPVGAVLVRQPLVRYDHRLDGAVWSLALEAPETTLASPDGNRVSPDDDRLPEIVGRYRLQGGFGNVALAALVRELRIDDPGSSERPGAALGFALGLSGRVAFGADELRFMLSGGNAAGRYVSANAFEDGRLDRAGRLDPVMSAGGYLAWQHWWSERWRSNLVAGAAWQGGEGAADAENERLASMHANLLFSPMPSTTAGLEVIFARRTRFDGRTGALGRLQLTALRKF